MGCSGREHAERTRQPVDFGRRKVVLRGRLLGVRVDLRVDLRSILICTVLTLAVIALALVALATGSYQLSIGQVASALSGGETGLVHEISVEWRPPRVAATVVFGGAQP